MKPLALTIEVSPRSVAAMRAAWTLRSSPRLKVSLRTVETANELPRGRVLRIEPGSRVEPILTLLWGAEGAEPWVADEQHAHAVCLGLNAAVFTRGREGYEWSGRAKPLPSRALVGTPDARRPWVLVAPGVRADERAVEQQTGLQRPQLHFIGPPPFSFSRKSSSVWWLPSPSVVSSLLGRVSSVLAPPGPLAWDAARFGVPVLDPEPTPRLPTSVVESRLARMVPGALVSDPEFWRGLGEQLAADAAGEWGTIAWLLRAREGRSSRPPPSLPLAPARLQRKLLKLRRDPGRFWADSAIVRQWSERSVGRRGVERDRSRA